MCDIIPVTDISIYRKHPGKDKNMRKFTKITALLLAIALLAAAFYGCVRPNEDPDDDGSVLPTDLSKLIPEFSMPGGFYIGKTTVKISYPKALKNAGYKIRITYDGSEPLNTSQQYGGGEISLPKKAIRTKFTGIGYNVNATVIRAAYFDKRGVLVGKIATATFFQVEKSDRFDLPVIVLTTDPANLNDSATGIFANSWGKGKDWERPCNIQYYDENGELVLSQDGGIRLFGGSSRGLSQRSLKLIARDSEYFGTDRYSGGGKFKYALFGEERKRADGTVLDVFDSFILRNGGNDSLLTPTEAERATFMRDGIANVIAGKAAPELMNMNYKPVVVFLNGEYYGLLNMREHENDNAIRNIYRISSEDKANICVISSELDTSRGDRYDGTWFYYVLDDGPEGELERFEQLLRDIKDGKYTYEEVCAAIDVEGFMKYCAVNLFLCNTDWPHNNIKVWRYCGEGGTGDLDGRWHFVFKDMDLGMGRYTCGTLEGYPIELYTKADSENFRLMLAYYMFYGYDEGWPSILEHSYPDTLHLAGLFAFLISNNAFRNSFKTYCKQLATEIWPVEALEKLITDSAAKIDNEMRYYIQKKYFGDYRFDMTTDYDTWRKAALGEDDSLLTWARGRSGENGYFMKQVETLMKFFEN